MPPKRRRVNTSTLPSTPQPVNPAAVEERARAAAVSAAALAEVNAGFDESDESDGDVDADELRVLPVRDVLEDGGQGGPAHVAEMMTDAAMGRVLPHTREAYNDNVGQCAVWALSAGFENEVVRVAGGDQLTLKWPLNQEMVIQFIEFLQTRQVPWPFTNKKKHMAPSTIGHFFSAFRDLFVIHNEAVPDALDVFFSNTYRKYTLFISQQKLDNLYPDNINSVGFTASIYEKICGALVGYWKTGKGATNAAVRYLRLFFIFCYALLGRGERVGRLRFTWICWSDDSMLVKVPTTKSDQSGALSYFKRVYANSLKPSVCPVLALAVEVFSRASTPFSDRVFPSSSSDYHKTSHAAAFRQFLLSTFGASGLGIQSTSITNHSAKRSGILTVSNAEVIHWHSAELRADHKCGITSNYQTSAAPQQDGVMGRLLSCLPLGEATFNITPPHFDPADISHIAWTSIVPHYDSFEADFQRVIPFLFASLVHHWDWLKDTLPPDHPLMVSKLAVLHTNVIADMKPKLLGGVVGARSVLTLTGNSRLCDMHVDIKATATLIGDIHSVVCAGSHGGVPSTMHSDTTPFSQFALLKRMQSTLEEVVEQNKKLLKTSPASAIAIHAGGLGQRPVFYLPQSWRLINGIKPEGLFLKWFVPDGNTCAWNDITNEMLPMHECRRSQQALLSRYRTVMQCLIGTTKTSLILRDVATSFNVCWDRMFKECGWTACFKNDSCITVYDKIAKDKKQLLRSTAVPGISDNPAIFAASLAVQAATMAQRAAGAASGAPNVEAHANQLFLSAMQLAVGQVDHQDEVDAVAENDADDSCAVAAPADASIPKCVPRGAIYYPSDAPRPPIDFSAASITGQAALLRYTRFVEGNAPRPGAQACWVCPHCLTANAAGAFHNQGTTLRRHVNQKHKSDHDENFGDYLHTSRLVWCHKPGAGKSWQPVHPI